MKTDKRLDINGFYIAKILGDIGFTISVPLVIFIYLGHILDIKFGTKIIFTLIGLPIAMTISIWSIYLKIKKINNK